MKENILMPGKNCRGIFEVHGSGLLIDGKNYYRAFYEAARSAKRYILMAGWQFERSVPLLRGKEQATAAGDVRLTQFLDALCKRNQELEVFILMWDFSAILALEKEWFNKWILEITTSDRIHFQFDSKHALGASHHQKIVIVDGAIAFVGGLDICANSWDDRNHWSESSERVLAGKHYEPYHDVQSFVTGPIAGELTKLFQTRWFHASGKELSLAAPSEYFNGHVRNLMRLPADKAAISVTRAQTLVPMISPVQDIRQLYRDAIMSAGQLIYMENQYFSSQAVYQALKERMSARDRPRPQIVLILPKRLHTLIEDISLSVMQTKMLRSLIEIANRNGQDLGVYYSAAASRDKEPERGTYIHSKILLVDDRFLSVGSANITNRSMGMDTELNVSWEVETESESDLGRSIRRVRGNLLAEHTGLRRISERRALGRIDGLVGYLNDIADRKVCRLRHHTMESFLEDISWIKDLMPEEISFDPEGPIIEESIYEVISRDKDGFFAKGFLFLNELSLPQTQEVSESEAVKKLGVPESTLRTGPSPNFRNSKRSAWYIVALIALIIAIILVIIGAAIK